MLEHFYYFGIHLLPFRILFIIGLVIVIYVPISYKTKKGNKLLVTPLDLLRYDKNDKIALIIGALLLLIGIVGVAIMDDRVGKYVRFTDKDGNVSIIKE